MASKTTLTQVANRPQSLLAFHRRWLLRKKFGVRWRGTLLDLAAAQGITVDGSLISHLVAGRGRSKRLERLIAEFLGLGFDHVWPEWAGTRHADGRRGKAPAGSTKLTGGFRRRPK